MRLADLAERLGCHVEGDGGIEIRAVRGLEDAGPQDVTFVAHERYLPRLEGSGAAAVILGEGLPPVGRPALRTPNPMLAFARALSLFHPPPVPLPGIHPSAVTAPDARVDPGAWVGPLCVLGPGVEIGAGTVLEAHVCVGAGVRIGRDCRIFPQVTLRDGVILGDRVTIHSGAVIGADGFGFARDGHRYVKIPQVGRVVIEDDVEIGANAAVDRATLGETRIGRGTKIDNLVQIAHNVRVGEDTVIVAQVGISGSSRIGSRVTLAGQVGIVDHVQIGDGVIVGAQAGVSKDIPSDAVVLGSPAIPHVEFKRQVASIARLPLLRKALQALEARLAALEARLPG
ncbi:MAG TPA: UDP-3-O-(3-hydroxymyristoyl)glucosamine N-acyltransferase [Candidatus Methylomirabilis sp.]|nr:UDP-3-O-(3-hydroxymyristoyl)glucosamine N-acyltransferase [Candidatus Methylomirabilis sp.]